jgi:hypothetical protein
MNAIESLCQELVTKLAACEASSWNLNNALDSFIKHNPEFKYSIHTDDRFKNCAHSVHEFRLSYHRRGESLSQLDENFEGLLCDIKDYIPLVKFEMMEGDFLGIKYKFTILKDF